MHTCICDILCILNTGCPLPRASSTAPWRRIAVCQRLQIAHAGHKKAAALLFRTLQHSATVWGECPPLVHPHHPPRALFTTAAAGAFPLPSAFDVSELEPIITVRGPHSQRMSSAANASLCNIRERKQRNLLRYFPAPQQLRGTHSCGKRARISEREPLEHFHGHEHTCPREFPRPRAHMYAHKASVRADSHTCHTQRQARHIRHFARSNTRALPPQRTRRGPKAGLAKIAMSTRQLARCAHRANKLFFFDRSVARTETRVSREHAGC